MQVWIPVSFGGHRGEVVSTEMPDCSTPVALDAALPDKARLGELRSLGVTLPRHTRGDHLRVRVDDFEESETDKRGRVATKASDESLESVFSQEADEARDEVFNSADRGIQVADSREIIEHGQRKQLTTEVCFIDLFQLVCNILSFSLASCGCVCPLSAPSTRRP